jgi:hypothetical protein
MLDTFQFRTSCLLVCSLKRNNYNKKKSTIFLPVVLCGFETYTLTLREEHRLMVFGNRVLRRVLDHGELKRQEDGENRVARSFFMTCNLRQV